MRTYTVKAGDTLKLIAEQFYHDPSKSDLIAKANNLADPNNIQVGQVLQIPDIAPPDTTLAPPIDASTFRLPSGKFSPEAQPKQMIVLHFTAGLTAESAVFTFKNQKSRVGTPYIVDRDGDIYEIFPPECWAAHLFRHNNGEDPLYYQLEKRTVPIEIVNVGPLKPDDRNPDQLNWWPPSDPKTQKMTFKTKWCSKYETDKYVAKQERDIFYYATFTEQQYVSVRALIDYLCARFNIPRQAPADKLKYDLLGLANYRGILCHQNFREDKYDIGPAFDWIKIGL
jgi:N-acetyl-anhydromuramyl-L-alanine amidase AmpD